MRYHQTSEARTRNVIRVRRVQGAAQSHHGCSAFRDRQARSGLSKAVPAQSEPSRSKAEAETRFPRPVLLVTGRFRFPLLPDQLGVGHALADDLGKQKLKAVEIVRVFAVVKPKGIIYMSTVSLSLHRVWPFASGAAWRLSPLPSVGRQVPCLQYGPTQVESVSSYAS